MKTKHLITIILAICMPFLFSSCNNNTVCQSEDAEYTLEELSSILSNERISNSAKVDEIYNLEKSELERANTYKEKIKSVYKEIVDDFTAGYQDIGFDLDSAYQSIDSYCEYLEKEFSANLEFYENLTIIKYHTGSKGAVFLATKKYESVKSYADKLEALYEDLTS